MEQKGLGQRLRALRLARGLSREEVAARAGVSRQAVEHWEAGRRTPKGESLEAVARVLGVKVDLTLSPDTSDLDDHAAEILLKLADVLQRVPLARRKALVAQIEELGERYPATPGPNRGR